MDKCKARVRVRAKKQKLLQYVDDVKGTTIKEKKGKKNTCLLHMEMFPS